MKIAIDIDGVLLDIIVEYCKIFNKRYGTNYQKEDVTSWDFFRDWNIDEETAFNIFFEIYANTDDVPFIDDDAPSVLFNLNKLYDVSIVSARLPRYHKQIVKKLQDHKIYKGKHYNNVILLHHHPSDIKLKEDFDIYIDDNPNLVEPIKRLNKRTLLLYDQPWNRDSICEKNVIRVYNWKDIEVKFKERMI
jgi:5'(3')-deoxyribonucleotidase